MVSKPRDDNEFFTFSCNAKRETRLGDVDIQALCVCRDDLDNGVDSMLLRQYAS